MNRVITARGVIILDGKLFCVRQKYTWDGSNRVSDYLCTPGGHVEENEPFEQAVERELIEELGIKPVIGQLLYVQQFLDEGVENIDLFFHIENASDYTMIDLSKTTHGNDEIAEYGFFEPATQNVLPKFFQTEALPTNFPVAPKFFNYLPASPAE